MGFNMGMKINFTPYKYAFTSNSIPKLPKEGIVMGYDDSISSARRASIREHLEERTGLGYLDYYELPKSEYEMEQMLKSWGLKIDKITKKIIIPPYLNVISLGNNNFRGALPENPQAYKDLKESGIKTIISATPQSWAENVAKNNGLEYIDLVVKNSYSDTGKDYIFDDYAFNEEDYFINKLKSKYSEYSKYDEHFAKELSDENFIENKRNEFRTKSRKFIDELVKAVRAWQKGSCFIGCDFGVYLTNKALSVIDVFNPKGDSRTVSYLSYLEQDCVKSLYEKLTAQDKKLMGWTKEFEKTFQKRFVHI